MLAQPVCASAAERNWSVYGAIKTTARGQMGHAVADKRVYCHEALHNRLKLQKSVSTSRAARSGTRTRTRTRRTTRRTSPFERRAGSVSGARPACEGMERECEWNERWIRAGSEEYLGGAAV